MTNFRPRGLPPTPIVVKNIIIINVIMVLAQFVLVKVGIDISELLGLHYWQSPQFRWWQFFTHMFMHGSPFDIGLTIEHIFFNMFGLWMFGSILESTWGPKRFIFFYIFCGLGAAFCHLGILTVEFSIFHGEFVHYQQNPTFEEFGSFLREHKMALRSLTPDSPDFLTQWGNDKANPIYPIEAINLLNKYYSSMINQTMVGASGAIFGLLFAFGYLFPNTELYIMFIPIPVKAKWAVAGYAAIELFSGVGRFSGDNVAHFAHLGGMLFAFILLSIWQKRNRNDFY